MYNKISQIVLNSGKANGANDVFVAQPDAMKESLAGKIFVIAEIEGKKGDSRKILDFIISNLEDYYYNDEKIALRDKIEGLKIENIFEAALAKTNKALADFLNQEKTKLNPATTNITLGVIYENKLHFSSYGNNRALLVFPRKEKYELVNIEANAADSNEEKLESDGKAKLPKLFSSIISGEIPESAYFVFTNETLPEYLSDSELIEIITKLPPVVASEQIKNTLAKINSYVPFLGIIVKNTVGSNIIKKQEEVIDSLSANTSISALNHTEERTEQMLSPAGLIDLRKVVKKSAMFLNKFSPNKTETRQRVSRQKKEKKETPELALNTVSLDNSTQKLNLPRKDSFLIKDKIFFKKKSNRILSGIKRYVSNIPKIILNLFTWGKGVNKKNGLLFTLFVIVVVILLVSLLITNINNRRQKSRQEFNDLVSKIEEKQNLVDSHLLYDDEEGAKIVLSDVHTLLEFLPNKKNEQQEAYSRLTNKLGAQEDKIQKIVQVDSLEEIASLSGLGVSNIIWAKNTIYSSSNNAIYEVKPGSGDSIKTEIETSGLSNPYFDGKDSIYYWSNNKIIQFNLNNKESSSLDINGLDESPATNFRIFSANLYVLVKDKNQIHLYRYNRATNEFGSKSDWIKDQVKLNQATDLGIDGNIYTLNSDGTVFHLFKGQQEDYKTSIILPATTSASKLTVGNDYLYILDKSSKRVIVLDKDSGQLLNQYLINSLQQIQDFAVNEDKQEVYILGNELIYKLKINQ